MLMKAEIISLLLSNYTSLHLLLHLIVAGNLSSAHLDWMSIDDDFPWRLADYNDILVSH